MRPFLSVIIPVYNVEDYIEKCARSLFEQTLDNIEYIFVDDCSMDKSIEILQQIVKDYPSREGLVKIVQTHKNSGQYFVRKFGMQFVSGKYLIHCDSDDWVDPTMYEEMFKIAENGRYDIVCCDFARDSLNEGVRLDSSEIDNLSLIRYLLIGKIHSSLCTKLVRTDVYNNEILYPKSSMREDMTLVIQLAYYSHKIFYYDKALYHYFINQKSISRSRTVTNIINRFCQSKNNAEVIYEFLNRHNIRDNYANEMKRLNFVILMELWPILHTDEGKFLWNSYPISFPFFEVMRIPVPISFKLKFIIYKLRLLSVIPLNIH